MTIQELTEKINSIKIQSPEDMLCLQQFQDNLMDNDWENADELIGNLMDEVHESGYCPEDINPDARNEADYPISEIELSSFIKKFIPEYQTDN